MPQLPEQAAETIAQKKFCGVKDVAPNFITYSFYRSR